MWRRVGEYWYTVTPCEHVAGGIYIACGVHSEGSGPLCLVMRRYKGEFRIVRAWSEPEWQQRIVCDGFWLRYEDLWIANSQPGRCFWRFIDGNLYTMRPAVREGGGPAGVVAFRARNGTGQDEIIVRWVDGGGRPEWVSPSIDAEGACEFLRYKLPRL